MRERKYIIGLDSRDRLIMKAGYVIYHKDLIDTVKRSFLPDTQDIRPIGGGFWVIRDDEIRLYGESSDFGRPRRLEEALKTDGDHFRRQVTMAERRIQGTDNLDYCESPVVYFNELSEKIYPEIGQAPDPGVSRLADTVADAESKESLFPVSPRGTNRTPSTKGITKAKKAKRRAQKKHYGKRK